MLLSALTTVHVIAGVFCLGAGAVSAFVKPKGGRWHRLAGSTFIRALAVSAGTAAVLLCFRFQPFFFALSVLSFYFGFSGTRVLTRGRAVDGSPSARAHVADWMAASAVLGVTVLAAYWSYRGVLGGDAGAVLGLLSFAVVAAGYDLWRFAFPHVRLSLRSLHVFEHLTKISGAYIAVWCAFTANVAPEGVPGVWTQIAPAVIGTPILLVVANRYFRKWRRSGTVGH
ncbi:MAG: hypothetical protein H7145_06150 [Akkermansiaceae bacterium]|nr:hypothetical protein [Armatimonadota bacterium]